MAEDPIAKILAKADELKVFPVVATRIQTVADDPDSSLSDLEQAVSLDTALSAKILKIANSPFYGLNRTVGNLRQALLVMGFEATRNMALALTMLSMGDREDPSRQNLWASSLQVASAAREIAKRETRLDSQEAFISGILHDIGMLLLLEVDPDPYAALLAGKGDDPAALLVREKELYSIDHAALGAACLEQWNLPRRIVLAVHHHHDLSLLSESVTSDERQAAAVLNLARDISSAAAAGEAVAELADRLAAGEACELLSVDRGQVSSVIDAIISHGEAHLPFD